MTDLSTLVENLDGYLQQQKELFSLEILFLGLNVKKEAHSPAGLSSEPGQREIPVMKGFGADTDKRLQLDAFFQQVKDCQQCKLAKARTQVVFGTGRPDAKVIFIGEGPGRDEDLKGEPFVGAAGKILDRMISKMGFTREEVYIANIVKCRPPANRNPDLQEIDSCLPYLQRQIEIIQPKYIFCLGRIAAATLLGQEANLTALRGKIYDFKGIQLFVTYHPAALLRNRKLFWQAYEDMKLFRQVYDREIGDKPPMSN